MHFKIVNPISFAIEFSYEADVEQPFGGPWGTYPHLIVPENLDADCVKVQQNGENIELVADANLLAAKVLSVKQAAAKEVSNQLWAEVLAQMETVYGTKDMNSATAYYLTWQVMLTKPNLFVGKLGLVNEAAVLAYANTKMAAAEAYGVWRMEKIAIANAAIQAIMNG